MVSEEEFDFPISENKNINKYKMALLFFQTKELKRLYENRMKLSPEQYRLVNKEWLDNYKNRYNYNEAIQNFNSFEYCSNYYNFKYKISQQLNINENIITNEDYNIINNCQIEKEKYQSNFEIPINIELVKEQFLQDCNLGNIGFPMCNVYIGDRIIFVIDDQRDSIAYNCSLIETQTNNYNFLIQVNSILIFPKSQILIEQLDNIISEGFNNYLNKRNIIINSNEQQKIIDSKNLNPIGFFINIKKNNDSNIQNNKIYQKNYNLNNNINQGKIYTSSDINRNVNLNLIHNNLNNNNFNNSNLNNNNFNNNNLNNNNFNNNNNLNNNNIYQNCKAKEGNYNQINNKNNLDQALNNKITFLENELKKMNDIIKELINKNNKLEERMNDLKKEKLEYKEIINKQNKNIDNLNEKLNLFDKKNNKFENEVLELIKDLREKEKEIKSLKSALPFEIKQGEKLMSIIFVSVDQKIHHSFICKNTDIFINLEKSLYDIYPKFGECENYFLLNGNKINKYKSLESNNIKDSDIITLNQYN